MVSMISHILGLPLIMHCTPIVLTAYISHLYPCGAESFSETREKCSYFLSHLARARWSLKKLVESMCSAIGQLATAAETLLPNRMCSHLFSAKLSHICKEFWSRMLSKRRRLRFLSRSDWCKDRLASRTVKLNVAWPRDQRLSGDS